MAFQSMLSGNLPAPLPDASVKLGPAPGLVALSSEEKEMIARACSLVSLQMQMRKAYSMRYAYEALATKMRAGA